MRTRRTWAGLAAVAVVISGVAAGLAFTAFTKGAGTASRTRSDLEDVLDLSTQPAEMAAMYHYVEDQPALFKQIPCYCGCGKALDHRDLFDCFVIKPGQYSNHASGCMVCGNEAKDVQRLAAEGQSVRDIRTWIDGEYSRYGPPTNTPR